MLTYEQCMEQKQFLPYVKSSLRLYSKKVLPCGALAQLARAQV